MIYNTIGDYNISKLGIGLMRFEENQNQIDNFISLAINKGINYFESGSFYINNNCEQLLGKALQTYPRFSFHIAAKFSYYHFKERQFTLEDYFLNQLNNHKTDYFDFYLIQAIDRNKINNELFDIINFFKKKKDQGYIKYLGFSFHDNAEYLNKIISNEWDFIQIQLNYYDWFMGEAKSLYNLIKKYNLPIFVMGAQKGGLLSSHYELTYKFLNTLDNVKMILNGSNEQIFLKKNVKIIEENKKITKKDLQDIKEHINKLNSLFFIPCTGCKYCENKCQNKINIYETFSLYNQIIKENDDIIKNKYFNLLKSEHSPLNCINCKQCELYCPQHLPIGNYMKNNIFNYRL